MLQACPAPSVDQSQSLHRWVSAQHIVLYIGSTQRHTHACLYEEPTGAYAGDGSLRLEHRSSQLRHGSLLFKRRSVGDGSPRF